MSDQEILFLVTKGHTSSYAIWSAMKKASKERLGGRRVMTYRNNNKRVIKLAKLGLMEELKPDLQTVNIHGRRDYKITKRGLEHVIHYVISHPPEDVKVITEYMDKFGLNKEAFAERLFNQTASMIKSTDEYLRYGKLDPLSIDIDSVTQLQRCMDELILRLRIIQSANVARSRRQLLTQQQVVKSTIKTERVKSESGRDIDITHITPSKELVDFQKQQQSRNKTVKNLLPSPSQKKKH